MTKRNLFPKFSGASNANAKCFDKLRLFVCRISLTHIRTNSDCVTKFFPPNLCRFADLKAILLLFYYLDTVFILPSLVRRLTLPVVLSYGENIEDSSSSCVFCGTGTPTIVETRSAYRAHFILDTNNFHSGGSGGSVSLLLYFIFTLPKNNSLYRVL